MITRTQKIYTTGYIGKHIENLPELLKSLAAVLIDVRFSPQSRLPHWSGDHLKRLLGKRYRTSRRSATAASAKALSPFKTCGSG